VDHYRTHNRHSRTCKDDLIAKFFSKHYDVPGLNIQGFIEGVAVYDGEVVRVEPLTCMHYGDERCLLKIPLKKPGMMDGQCK